MTPFNQRDIAPLISTILQHLQSESVHLLGLNEVIQHTTTTWSAEGMSATQSRELLVLIVIPPGIDLPGTRQVRALEKACAVIQPMIPLFLPSNLFHHLHIKGDWFTHAMGKNAQTLYTSRPEEEWRPVPVQPHLLQAKHAAYCNHVMEQAHHYLEEANTYRLQQDHHHCAWLLFQATDLLYKAFIRWTIGYTGHIYELRYASRLASFLGGARLQLFPKSEWHNRHLLRLLKKVHTHHQQRTKFIIDDFTIRHLYRLVQTFYATVRERITCFPH